MNKLTVQVIFALCICVTLANCAVMMERRHPNASPNQCISSVNNLVMKSGESISVPGKCMKAMCKTNGDINYYTCGVVGVPEGYKLVQADQNLPYPHCCSTKFVPI